mgnify:CR=1 FL=1
MLCNQCLCFRSILIAWIAVIPLSFWIVDESCSYGKHGK